MTTGPDAGAATDPRRRAGLCATCSHAETITSSRGAAFVLCRLSQRDARFPKYPRLPVTACAGYTASGPSSRSSADGT